MTVGMLILLFFSCRKEEKARIPISKSKEFKRKQAQLNHLINRSNQGDIEGLTVDANQLLISFKSSNDSLEISQTYDLIAKTNYYGQKIDKAIFNWREGLRYAPTSNDELRSMIVSNLGSAYMYQGYQRTAISYFLEAREYFKNAKKQSDNYWINYLNIGVCYMELDDFKSAQTYFEKIPFSGNPSLDVIVPLNFAKLYALQSNKRRFKEYISIALKNQDHAPFYQPVLKEVHLEYTGKLCDYKELQRVFSAYKSEYGKLNTTFDLSLWKVSIALGKPIGSIKELKNLQESIENADYFLLISYYQVLTDWYVAKNDYKSAFISSKLMDYSEAQSAQENAKDKLYDYTLLSKRNELQAALKKEKELSKFQEIRLRNRSIVLYALIIIFTLIIASSVQIYVNQRRKNKLNLKQIRIHELELKLAKEEHSKLENTLEFKDKKLESILDTVGKIAILKKQLDNFFTHIEKTTDIDTDFKATIKEAKLDFNLFFNNYQDLAVLSNLVGTDSSKVNLIKQKYPELKDSEFRVLLLIIQNYTSKEMAMLLSCTEKNIEYYRAQIRKKLAIPKEQSIHDFIDFCLNLGH
jgi:DNA-binding CsgD family transcriptional regulator